MYQHVPLASLGSPGLPVSSYDQLGSHRRLDRPWPPDPPAPPGPHRRRGLLRRVGHLVRPAVRTS
ncbi:MAG TPA: hypothetical protein VGC37_02295 [Friedmanniella sp.]